MKKKLLIVLLFLLLVVLPFIEVDSAVTHTVEITNPMPSESFSFSTTNEVFTGYSITGGLTPFAEYRYEYWWEIDSGSIDSGFGFKDASNGGSLILSDEFDTTVDISLEDVGEHSVYLKVRILLGVEVALDDHTHIWSRDNSPPENIPSIVFTTPSSPYTSYNYSLSGTSYNCAWVLSDLDDNVVTMNLYLEDVLQTTWNNPSADNYNYYLTIDSEKVYIILVNGTDDDSNIYSSIIYLVAYFEGAYIDVEDPSDQYHSSAINFNLESGDPDGLDNLSYSISNYGYSDLTVESQFTNESLLGGVTKTYSLNWSDYMFGCSVGSYTKYKVKSGWDDSNYGYRMNFTYTLSAAVTNQQFLINLTTSNFDYDKVQNDGDDIRFYDDSGNALDYWVQSWTDDGNSYVWVEEQLMFSGDKIIMYYGYASASSASNGDNTFEFFHDYNDYANWAITGVELTITQSGTDELLEQTTTTNNNFATLDMSSVASTNYIIDYRMKWNNPGGSSQQYFEYRDSSDDGLARGFNGLTTDEDDMTSDGTTVTLIETMNSGIYYVRGVTITEATEKVDYVVYTDHYASVIASDLDNNAPDSYTVLDYLQWTDGTANSVNYKIYLTWIIVRKPITRTCSVAVGSSEEQWEEDSGLTVTETIDSVGINTVGEDFDVLLSTAVKSKACFNITYVINDTAFYVYTNSSDTSQTDSFTLDSAAWDSLSDGWFNINVSLFDDSAGYYSQNITYYKDTTAPTLDVTMPYDDSEWFVSEVPSLDYTVDWSENDGLEGNRIRFEMNYNASDGMNLLWYIDEDYPEGFPTCREKIVDSFGEYYFRLTIIDSAGNSNQSSTLHFEVFNERTISISCTSQYNAASVDVSHYLRFYVDGIRYSYDEIVVKAETFEFVITDVFGNELYESDNEVYASTKNYQLPLRGITFTNSLNRMAEYLVTQNLGDEVLNGYVSASGSVILYLLDGEYDVAFAALNVKISDGHWYLTTDRTITTSSTAASFILACDTMQLPGGSIGSSVEERMNKLIVGFGLALLFILLLVVVKGNVRNTGRFVKAKITRTPWQSVEDERIDKSVHRNKVSRKREKEEERKKKEVKRVGGMPERIPTNNEEYRRRYG